MTRREFSLSLAAGWSAARKITNLEYQTAEQMALALRARKISATELMQETWARIDRLNPKVNAIILPFRQESLKRAKEADAALAKKQIWGPLHGVPVTIKEAFAMEGVPTSAGVKDWLRLLPKRDADAVARYKKAGAIIVGKTNVPVMLMDWQSANPIYGITNNPWDVTRTPGGSSRGSAAALAAGLGYLSLGSDIGGSIRVPSHFCGTYGHKPTLNVVSLRGHVPPPAVVEHPLQPDLACVGPMSRSARDLMLAMNVLAGPDGDEAKAWTFTMPKPRQKRLQDFRIGYVFDHPRCPLANDVAPVFDRTLSALSRAGAKLTKGFPPGLDLKDSFDTYAYLLGAVTNVSSDEEIDRLREEAKKRKEPNPLTDSVFLPHKYWERAAGRRMVLRALWQVYFQNFDVFLMPVEFLPAFPHNHAASKPTVPTASGPRPYFDMIFWPHFAIVTGLPATAVPIGLTKEGLPVGLQVLGPYLEDATPLEFAAHMEPVTGGFAKPPGY